VVTQESIEAWLGAQVKALRRQRELTQDELAERSGLSVDAIRRIERGAFSASLNTLQKLSRGLNVSLTTLFQTLQHERADVDQVCELLGTLRPDQVTLAWRVLRALFLDPRPRRRSTRRRR
jgi:transcriptional regulator with XRE-family HTH domain